MRNKSNMLGPNYFWMVKKLSKMEKIEIFSVFIVIFSENWCVRSQKIWERIITWWLRRAGLRNARSRAVTRLTVYRAIEVSKKINRWAKCNSLGLKLSEKLVNIWYFHLRKYELLIIWERRVTCWAQIILEGLKKCQKLKKLRFLVFLYGFSVKIGVSGAKKYEKE